MSNTENIKKELQTIEEQIARLETKCREIEGKTETSDDEYAEYDKLSQELEALKAKQNRILTFVATDKRGGRRN